MLEKEISDYMMEQEKENTKEEPKKEDIDIYDIDLATYELLLDKYKDSLEEKFYDNKLIFEEYETISKIYKIKDDLLNYYNENYDKVSSMDKDELARFAKSEVYLHQIYIAESKYKNNKERIKELSSQESLIPAGKLLLKTLEEVENQNIIDNKYIDDIVDISINKYNEITKKYNDGLNEKDKEDYHKIVTYKMKLIDAYNSLLFRKSLLTDEELKKLANYETKLIKIDEIDAKYQNNIDEMINELKNTEKFLVPSAKMWLSSLEQEKERRKSTVKEDLIELRNNLFDVVQLKKDEEDEKYFITEMKDAYDKAISYAKNTSPALISINFGKEDNKEEADVVISNKSLVENVVIYQRTYSIDKLNNEVMPALRKMFADNNELQYSIKTNTACTKNANLLAVTKNCKVFRINNATDEFIDDNKEQLEKLFDKDNKVLKK